MLEYYNFKVKYFMMFKDITQSRDYLYKIDELIRSRYENDHDKRTDFLVLQAQNFSMHKEVQPAHYSLNNWL